MDQFIGQWTSCRYRIRVRREFIAPRLDLIGCMSDMTQKTLNMNSSTFVRVFSVSYDNAGDTLNKLKLNADVLY